MYQLVGVIQYPSVLYSQKAGEHFCSLQAFLPGVKEIAFLIDQIENCHIGASSCLKGTAAVIQAKRAGRNCGGPVDHISYRQTQYGSASLFLNIGARFLIRMPCSSAVT